MTMKVAIICGAALCCVLTSRALAQRQIQKVTGPPATAFTGNGYGGRSVVDGDWSIVTASGVASGTGQAFVYHRTNETWQETQQLFHSDPNSSDQFGSSVDLDGDIAVIGAYGSDGLPVTTTRCGAAYVFERVGNTWIERQKLLPSIPFGQVQFGHAVAIDGDRIVVGAWFDSWSGSQHGAAYVYERVGTTWTEVSRFQPTGMPGGAGFGISVSVDGDHIACGTHWGKAAYVFQRSAQGVWSQQQKLDYTGNALQFTWNYGRKVVLNGSTLFVSSEDTVGTAVRGGRTYVYEEIGGTWTEVQTVTSLDLESSDYFEIDDSRGELAVASALDEDNGSLGAAYVFKKTINGWIQISKVLSNDGQGQHYFYFTPTLSDNLLMIGAPGDDEACTLGNNCDTGAVYFFDLAPDATQYGSCLANAPCGNADNHGGCRNSTGRGAILQASGSGSVSADDLVLEVREMPAGTATMMFMGAAQGSVTFGSGQLVALGGSLGLYRLGVQFADGDGVIVRPPGLVSYSQTLGGFGAITAGQTWNFQCWYRDVLSPCAVTNNLSNGLSVNFRP